MLEAVFAPVSAKLQSNVIHMVFERGAHCGAADAAHRAGRRRVGIDQPAHGAEFTDAVIAGAAMVGEGRHIGHLAGIGTIVHIGIDITRQDIAVRIQSRAHLDDRAFAAIGRGQILDPGVGDFDRPAAGGFGQRGGVWLDAVIELAAEAAADRVANDAHIGRRNIQKLRHPVAHIERKLMAGMDGVATAAIDGDGAFRLEIGLVLALRGKHILHHECRRFEDRIDAARVGAAFGRDIAISRKVASGGGHIILPVGMNQRRAGQDGGFEVKHRRARLYLKTDCRDGGARLGQTIGRDSGNGFADIAHPVAREQWCIPHTPPGQYCRHIIGGNRGPHTRHGARLAEVTAEQLSRRMRRTQQHAIEHAGFFIVVGIDRLAVHFAPSVGADCRGADMAHAAGAPS